MAEKKRAWLTVDLGENGKHSFDSVEDVRAWIEEDQKAWEWMASKYGDTLLPAKHWRTNWEEMLEDLPRTQKDLRTILEDYYVNKGLVHHASPRGEFMHILKQINSDQRFSSSFLRQVQPSYAAPLNSLLRVIYEWSPKGFRGRVFRDKRQSEALLQELARSQREHEGAIAELRRQHEQEIEKFKTRVDELVNEKAAALDEKRSGWDEEFNALLDSVHEEFEKEKEIYKNELLLKAPVEYWELAQKRNRFSSLAFGITFIALLAMVMVALVMAGPSIIAYIGDAPNLAKAGLVLFGGSLVLWLLRMVSRLFLSSYHQAQDAAERVTMMKAYLALLRDEGVEKDKLELALSAVFRPGATGIVKDESLPQWNAAALVEKFVSGGK